MSRLEWKPEYSVGNAAVDREHRELIGTINAVIGEIREGAATLPIVEGLGEIYAGIASHFALEERIMREAGYREYRAHKEDHESLLDELSEIIDAVELGETYDEEHLSYALDAWFSDHFRTHDAGLHGKL